MEQTFAEKILAQKARLDKTEPGQIVEIHPDLTLSVDNTVRVQKIFKRMDGKKIFSPDKHVIVFDHTTPASTTQHAENHRIVREFVKEQNLEHFFDVGRGICHQILIEEGLALPGKVILGADSHTTHAGAVGAFSAGIGHTEMASILALGRIWLRVPESFKLVVHGRLPQYVTAKDLVLNIIADLGADAGLYMSVEWHGDTISALNLDQRAVLTNMMAEMGAKNSYIPPDETVFDYLKGRAKWPYKSVYPDPGANYSRIVEYDATQMEPVVACPHAVDNVKPLSQIAGQKVDQCFIGTCTNGRLDDLAAAAAVLKNRRVAPETRLLIIPASANVYKDALKAGFIEIFIDAGAMIESPGCGPCLGSHMGVPAVGEVTVSTANRNFHGRMGTKNSDIYLASPAVAAASAVAGIIIHPKEIQEDSKWA